MRRRTLSFASADTADHLGVVTGMYSRIKRPSSGAQCLAPSPTGQVTPGGHSTDSVPRPEVATSTPIPRVGPRPRLVVVEDAASMKIIY